MKRYFFYLVSPSMVTEDDAGEHFEHDEAAIDHARQMAKRLAQQTDGEDGAVIRVLDHERRVVCDVLLSSYAISWRL